MVRINKLILFLFFLLAACGQVHQKKPTQQEILKKGTEMYAKYGCAVCHSLDGKEIYGPPLNDIYMKKITVIRQGKEIVIEADREYLKKSISDPRYEKVIEYKNKEMPISNFSAEEVEILVEYLIALDGKQKND